MVTRYSSSAACAAFVTLLLLYLMQQMIAMGRPALGEPRSHRLVPYITVERTPPPVQTRERTERRDPVEPPPLPPTVTDTGGTGPTIAATPPAEPVFRAAGPARTTFVDGDALPIVKVSPIYPITALERNLEGHVIVEFTIERNGSVRDVFVVESTHRVFERAAVEAATKFRYRPRVIDGTPVVVRGVRHLMTFELED